MRNSFVFYGSWWEAIKNLPRDVQGDVLTAIIEYGLTGVTTGQLKPIAKAMLAMAKTQIDINNQRFENGKKGGRKKTSSNQTETNPKPSSNQTETNPKPNVNDNVNDNDIITPDSRNNSLCTTTTTTEEGELIIYSSYIAESKQDQNWLDIMCMNFHVNVQTLKSYMDEFRQDCLCRGVDDRNKTLRDFKQHFNNWLRIRICNEIKNNNEHRQSNGAAATREQRQAESAQLVAEILARDN